MPVSQLNPLNLHLQDAEIDAEVEDDDGDDEDDDDENTGAVVPSLCASS